MEKAVICLGLLVLCQTISAYPSSGTYSDLSKRTLLADSDDFSSDELESDERLYTDDDDQELGLYLNELRELAEAIEENSAPHSRHRRQTTSAMNLAGSHTRPNGSLRPVGQVHGIFRPSGGGTLPNYNIGATAGLGSVLWRSPNRQHSIGVGATVDHSRGSFGGIRTQTPFKLNTGIGYRFNF